MPTHKLVTKTINQASTEYVGRDGDLFFDTDSNQFRYSDGNLAGGYQIAGGGTSNTLVNGSHVVSLGSDGTLTAPGNIDVGTTGTSSAVNIQGLGFGNVHGYPTMLSVVADNINPYAITVQNATAGLDKGLGVYVEDNGNIAFETISNTESFNFYTGSFPLKQWTFEADGTTTFATGGRITSAGKGGTVLDGGFGQSASLTAMYANGNYAACVTGFSNGTLDITTYNDGGPTPANVWTFSTSGVLNLPDDVGDIRRNGASVLPASNLPSVEITATSTPGYYYGQGNITINVSSTTTPTAVGVLMTSAIDGGYIPANIWVGTNTTGSQTIHYNNWGSGSHYIAQAYVTNTAGTAYSAPVVGQSDYCFAKGTLITLADGTTKPVEHITYADQILTWDLDNGKFTSGRPMWIKKAETADWYSKYTFSDGTELKLVATHRIFNKQAGKFTSPVNAILHKHLASINYPVKDETPVGTISFNSAGEEVTLISKQHVWQTVEHYSLIVDYHMNTFANGIMTGHAQSSIYPIVDMKFVKDQRAIKDISEFAGIPLRFVTGMRLPEHNFDMNYIRDVCNILLSKEVSEQISAKVA